MLPPTAVVFDLDGTLIDSRGDIAAAANHALQRTGRAPLPSAEIVRHVGDGARALCARVARLPEASDEVDALVKLFSSYYEAHPMVWTRWTRGAPEALDELAALGLPLGICTNKPRPIVDAVLSALGARTRFRAVVGAGDLPEKKPAPGPLLAVAQQLDADIKRCVMVGDGLQDIECARNAGSRVIAVVGFTSADRLEHAQPDTLIDSMSELPDIIRRWRDATARVMAPDSVRGRGSG